MTVAEPSTKPTTPAKADNTRKAWLNSLKKGDKAAILCDGRTYLGTVTTHGRWELIVSGIRLSRRDGISAEGIYLTKATPSVVRAAHATLAADALTGGIPYTDRLTKTDLETIGAILARAKEAE
ncbi:MAG: hypothetical protein R3E87_14960 [Burkholderiaceae bacterium]